MRRVLRRERVREARDVGEKEEGEEEEEEGERSPTSRSRGVTDEDTEEYGKSANEVETPQTEFESEFE